MGEDCKAFFEGLLVDGERRADLDGLPPSTDRGEKKQATLKAEFDDSVGEIVVRRLCSRLDDLHAADESNSGDVADELRMLGLDLLQPSEENWSQFGGIAGKVVAQDFTNVSGGGDTANGIARVGAGHGARRKLVHDFCTTDHR